MSRIALGLAESVREWFAHSGGGTAVETAPPVEAVKTKRAPSRSKKKAEESHEDNGDGGNVAVAEAPSIEHEARSIPSAPHAPSPVTEAPTAPDEATAAPAP